ncbi:MULTISPECIES: ABC transporter substrate-binding protein [unclassified Leifsonia]|uniref:ABC transporter substrate-binding protein n=1 Tax=unclassified Leifsonia TaxID=2663824 RepID=UPI0006F69D08|nr:MULTISPECIES: ABC transporter substrate-binding protein [unclassified Leifsonia]KQX06466.1 ABC transporter substrate-binding protein [Leifsonia sp. Root1293]KRA10749.1 ABC transporter substrate-binding protein [Leifsonia sp. Root60]
MPLRTIRTRALALAVVAAGIVALSGCAGASSDSTSESGYVTDGKLTIGTAEPAYYPWVIDDKPESGEGFESAVAYAVAGQLGFADSDVVWVRSTFDEAIAPGPKDFDFNLQQFSITDERKQAVDFSSPYYETTQTVITIASSPAAGATSIADLKKFSIGAQTGTTSLTAVENVIAPDSQAQVFNSNDDAKLALQNGTVDAIVVDLPTAFYLTGAELDGGKIIGQLPQAEGTTGDQFGLVLAKDSPLTTSVSEAVDALREDGTLDELATKWLGSEDTAPVLK